MRKGKMLKVHVVIGLLVGCLAISACSKIFKPQAGHPAITDMNRTLQTSIANNAAVNQKIQKNIPQAVNDALIPDISIQNPAQKKQTPRFNVAVNNAPANNFFMGLVKGTQQNMAISPDVKGTITLNLKNVTIEETLQAVHDIYGYEYKKTSYGYQIFPRKLETKMFTVNYLDVDRTGKSNTSVSSGQTTQSLSPQGSGSSSPETANAFSSGSDVAKNVSPASSVETKSKSDFWKDLNLTLSAIVGKADGRKIIINADAGIVLIRAYPNELQKAAKYMDYVQNSMTRQVIIDAKILEVRLDAGYQAGIDWTLFGNNVNQTANQEYTTGNSRINDGLKVFSQIFTLGAFYHHNSFSAVIQLLSTQGNIQILSSPRIATLNNQKAIIKVGQDEFFITNVENTTIGSGVSTENNQDIDLTPFFSGIALDVTPQISQSGEVILHIHPIISKVTDQNKKFVVSGQPQDLPLALSTIRVGRLH
jgi:MSHA biogenesis protein MshL